MFDSHVKSLCKKASQKLNALSRVAYQLDFNQRKLLMNAFITSQFSYAPVVWMFHSRKQNHHINRIHERALRVAYKDYNSSIGELLEKDNSCKIHDRNIQKLVTEFFKVKINLAPKIMKEVFEIVEGPYPLRNVLQLKSRKMQPKQHLLLRVNPLSFSSQRSKIGFLKTALANFVKLTSSESATCRLLIEYVFFMTTTFRSGSTSHVTPGVKPFVAIVNDW